MQAQIQQIQDRCVQVIAKAKELYGLDFSKVQIRFDLKGRAAGQAYCKAGQYGVRFNSRRHAERFVREVETGQHADVTEMLIHRHEMDKEFNRYMAAEYDSIYPDDDYVPEIDSGEHGHPVDQSWNNSEGHGA